MLGRLTRFLNNSSINGHAAEPSAQGADPYIAARDLNAVERFFSEITAKRIRRGSFPSVPKLIKAITAYVEDHNAHAQPFVWRKSAKAILKKTPQMSVYLRFMTLV